MSNSTVNVDPKVTAPAHRVSYISPADIERPLRTPITRGPYAHCSPKRKSLRSLNQQLASTEFALMEKATANTVRLTGSKRF